MRTLQTVLSLPLALAALGCLQASEPPSPKLAADLDAYLGDLAKKDELSGVVLLTQGSETLFSKAYGFADRERNIPNRIDTKFNLASMNKMFTGMAIAQLAEKGRLSFDDKVGKHLPDYPNREVAEKVTLHHLLTHTSGLGSYWNPRYRAAKDRLRTLGDFLPTFADAPLAFQPGERFEYSNAGYIVLGLIVERVSGESYADYVRRHIYEPAGMTDTAFFPKDQEVPNRAVGYRTLQGFGGPPLPGGPRPNTAELGRIGGSAGGGYSTAPDLLKFATALREHRLLSAAMTEMVLTGKVPVPASLGMNVRYGYGFFEEKEGGHRVVGHRGDFPGVHGLLDVGLDDGTTLVILSNVDARIPAIRGKIRKLLAG
ncbi:MAG TPA: serine hydrolase domain-containing protein [Thermoanaerobaculia bacterium]|jgi:CubicO group peptidase (beta-lactamase class C family)|nr:serine hydrolase domain-containing protein [Thermoanaerobaculia bacterium]